MTNQHEIFVSYAWEGDSEALVDQLCEAFLNRGHRIVRDKSAMTYRDSIRRFMDRIGRGKFILAVINDKYMRSEYCMYEAYRMFQSPAFKERIFPVVLPDADIFSFSGQAAYLKYWNQAYQDRQAEYLEIAQSSPTMVAPLTERLRDIEMTTRFINDFMAEVADMNVLTGQMHLEANFSQLIQAIEEKMQEREGLEPPAPAENRAESEPPPARRGSGVYIGGSVHTGGGDFVGGDKYVYGSEPSGAPADELGTVVRKLRRAVAAQPDTPEKTMALQAVNGLEEQAKKGDGASEENSRKWFQFLLQTMPEVGREALELFARPIQGLSKDFQELAGRLKNEPHPGRDHG